MKSNKRFGLLREIQELEFTAIELNLFLDTHPEEQQALRDYIQVAQRLDRAVAQYERAYGPLFNFGFSPSEYPWRWIEEPWPWERYEAWREV